jgi:hypothetical protein
MKKANLLPEEATQILESSLNEGEIAELADIKQELSRTIRWGRVLDGAFGPIFRNLETLILGGGEEVAKKNPPTDSLFPRQRDFILSEEKSQIRRHYVVLMLMKKLLGGLKTRVNQALANIPTLDDLEADRLMALADEFDRGEQDFTRWSFPQERPEEPDPEVEERRFRKPEITASLGLERYDGRAPIRTLELGDGGPCTHVRTRIRLLRADGENRSCDELQEYCRDCRNVISTRLVTPSTLGKRLKAARRQKRDQPCQHRYVEWVPGQEGKAARCCDKKGCTHTITDEEKLQTFQWEKAGLEPYGDVPDQDEVIIL